MLSKYVKLYESLHFKYLNMWIQPIFFLAVFKFSTGILFEYIVTPHQEINIVKKGNNLILRCHANQNFQFCTFHHGNQKCVQENGKFYKLCDYPKYYMYKSKYQNFYCEIHLKSVKETDYGNWTCELEYVNSFGVSYLGMASMEIEKPFEVVIESLEPKVTKMENDETYIYCTVNKPYKNCIFSHTYSLDTNNQTFAQIEYEFLHGSVQIRGDFGQYYKERLEFTNENNLRCGIKIKSLKIIDSGIWKCELQALKSVEKVYGQTKIRVEKFEFIDIEPRQLSSFSAIEGSDIHLSVAVNSKYRNCTIKNSQNNFQFDLSFKPYRQNSKYMLPKSHKICNNHKHRFIIWGNYENSTCNLFIKNSTSEDSGQWLFEISRGNGQNITKEITINIEEFKQVPIIENQQNPAEVAFSIFVVLMVLAIFCFILIYYRRKKSIPKKSENSTTPIIPTLKEYSRHPFYTNLPNFLVLAITKIEKEILPCVGIYRLSGNTSTVKKLKKEIDADNFKNFDHDLNDEHVLANTVKLFFRELPQPLISMELCYEIKTAIIDQNPEENPYQMVFELLKSKMTQLEIHVLKYLLHHLQKIANQPSNRMDSRNLAIVFSPNLIRRTTIIENSPGQNDSMLAEVEMTTQVMSWLIQEIHLFEL